MQASGQHISPGLRFLAQLADAGEAGFDGVEPGS